jgi:hypothetical protein
MLSLAREGLLELRKIGRMFYFIPPEDLAERLKRRPKKQGG